MKNNASHQAPVKLNAEKPNCKHSRLVYKNQSSHMTPVCVDSKQTQALLRSQLHFCLCTYLCEFCHWDWSVSFQGQG